MARAFQAMPVVCAISGLGTYSNGVIPTRKTHSGLSLMAEAYYGRAAAGKFGQIASHSMFDLLLLAPQKVEEAFFGDNVLQKSSGVCILLTARTLTLNLTLRRSSGQSGFNPPHATLQSGDEQNRGPSLRRAPANRSLSTEYFQAASGAHLRLTLNNPGPKIGFVFSNREIRFRSGSLSTEYFAADRWQGCARTELGSFFRIAVAL